MIDISEISNKAYISVIGYVVCGYSILSKINCRIPNVYWYPDNFMRIVIMVFERILKKDVSKEFSVSFDRNSDFTMEITAKVLEDMNRYHKFAPDVKRDPDIETDIELFIDALVMEVSMFTERECIPPASSRVTRIYLDGGHLCVDINVT